MKYYLLPVYAGSLFKSLGRFYGLKDGEWWSDKPPLDYPHALISYIHWKQPIHFPKSAYIFGDSGGFGLVSQKMKHEDRILDPVGVLEWQESLCTVGCIVDKPPREGKQRPWEKALAMSVAHTKRALPVYLKLREKGSSFRWWGVLHGNNEEEVRAYHKAISDVYPFTDEGEGWAIRAEPQVNIYAVSRSLRILQHLGIKKAHFLAATSQDVIATLLTLGPRAGLEVVSYDSTSAIKFGANRKLWLPSEDFLTFSGLVEAGKSTVCRDYVTEKCPCPVCAHMRVRMPEYEGGRRWQQNKSALGSWLMWFQLHNLYVQQNVAATQAVLAQTDPTALLKDALGKAYSPVMRIFEEDGHEPGAIVRTGGSTSLLDYLQ